MYPELFSLHLRTLAFKLLALDPLSAVKVLSKEFYEETREDAWTFPAQCPLPIKVDRAAVGVAGQKILSRFAANRVPLAVEFHGELGKGPGVTREFFMLLSQFYGTAKDETMQNLWRHDTSNGLFPSPIADPHVFEDIGCLVAKALTMQCQVDLPLNPAFFSLIRGEPIDISDIDPSLARSLQSDLTGLSWTYPGYESAMSPAYEQIDATNQDVFVEEVKRLTFENARVCAQSFLVGFQKVLSWDLCNVFTTKELIEVTNGTTHVTMDELEHGIELDGFESTSETIRSLFQMLANNDIDNGEFWTFVTGSNRLPCGGLAAVQPKVCIQNAGPESSKLLPSAQTCYNTLKLRQYESKSDLRSNILLALSEGKGSFQLG